MTPPPAVRALVLLAGLLLALPAIAQGDDYAEAARLFKQGQLAPAMERVDGFLKANPKDARGRFLKGLILTEQNKPAEAIKVFQALTEDYPELPEPYNNLAVLYASQGQYEKAKVALEMAIRTHPSYATAHENLGDIYAKMASQAYDKALQLDKSNTSARTKLNLIKDLFPAPAAAKPVARTEAPKVAAAAPEKPAAPAAAPAPAASAPAAAAAKAPATDDVAAQVVRTVNSWAKAWSANDVERYLAYYAPDFKVPGGEPRSAWESQRRARIAKPKKIEVSVDAPRVTVSDANRVTVTFRQHYRSDSLKSTGTKTLVMVRSGERWLIQEERVGG